MNRRRVLWAVAAAGATGLAGCIGLGGSSGDGPSESLGPVARWVPALTPLAPQAADAQAGIAGLTTRRLPALADHCPDYFGVDYQLASGAYTLLGVERRQVDRVLRLEPPVVSNGLLLGEFSPDRIRERLGDRREGLRGDWSRQETEGPLEVHARDGDTAAIGFSGRVLTHGRYEGSLAAIRSLSEAKAGAGERWVDRFDQARSLLGAFGGADDISVYRTPEGVEYTDPALPDLRWVGYGASVDGDSVDLRYRYVFTEGTTPDLSTIRTLLVDSPYYEAFAGHHESFSYERQGATVRVSGSMPTDDYLLDVGKGLAPVDGAECRR